MKNKLFILRINSANLWVRSNEFFTYPMLLKGFKKDIIYSAKEILQIFTEPRENIENQDNRRSDHGIVENVKGINISGEKVHHKGLNLFRQIKYNQYKLSDDAIELRDLYHKDRSSDQWKIKLAEILMKYELRFRALLYHITKLNNRLKNFVIFKNNELKFLGKKDAFLESPNGDRIYLFKNKNYNKLLKNNLFEIIGPYIRHEIELKSIKIPNDADIKIQGSRSENPNTSINYKAIKLIFELFFDLKLFLIENDGEYNILKLNHTKFFEKFDNDLIKNILKEENQLIENINQKFSLILEKYYIKFKSDTGFISIRDLLNYTCNDLNILVEKEKKFSRFFWDNEGIYFHVVETSPGSRGDGPGISPDEKIRLYKLEFFKI